MRENTLTCVKKSCKQKKVILKTARRAKRTAAAKAQIGNIVHEMIGRRRARSIGYIRL